MKVRITDVLFTDRKWFWELFRYCFTDFGPKIDIEVILPVLTVMFGPLGVFGAFEYSGLLGFRRSGHLAQRRSTGY